MLLKNSNIFPLLVISLIRKFRNIRNMLRRSPSLTAAFARENHKILNGSHTCCYYYLYHEFVSFVSFVSAEHFEHKIYSFPFEFISLSKTHHKHSFIICSANISDWAIFAERAWVCVCVCANYKIFWLTHAHQRTCAEWMRTWNTFLHSNFH